MPSVNLRLTDEQHARLVEDAAANERSLQREIIHQLFSYIRTPTLPSGALADFRPARTQPEIEAAATRPVGGKRFSGPDLKPSEKKAAKR